MALRDRLSAVRNFAEDALERVETRWDQAMDVFHGRPIRDPHADDPRQLPQPPGQLPPPPPGVEHEPTDQELAQGNAYDRAMWPDLEEDEPDRDAVRTIREGEWLVPGPGVETKLMIGQSDEGYHYAVDTSYKGGDEGDLAWSKPYPTLEEADDAGSQALHQRHYREIADDNAITEVRARDWWEDQRAEILEAPVGAQQKEAELDALGPEPSDDARVWLNAEGERVEQPSVELQPIEIERPETEERADREEHAIGLEREPAAAGLEL